jgi:hypothetical protein
MHACIYHQLYARNDLPKRTKWTKECFDQTAAEPLARRRQIFQKYIYERGIGVCGVSCNNERNEKREREGAADSVALKTKINQYVGMIDFFLAYTVAVCHLWDCGP